MWEWDSLSMAYKKPRGEASLLTLSLQLQQHLLLSLKAHQTIGVDLCISYRFVSTSKQVMAFLPKVLPLLLLAVVCVQLSGGKTITV